MQMTKFFLILMIGLALFLTGCPEPHTHDWGNWVVTTQPTATTPGEETRTCNTCGEKLSRPIPATGNPDPTHTHEWGAWQYNATEHWKECTAGDGAKTGEGNHDGDPCTVCEYTSANHEHTFATAWSHDATQHWKECTANDGAKTDVGDHDWGGWQDTTPATITAEGEATRTCTTCGATETKTVAKLAACTCNPKEHYLSCDCTGTDCTCAVIPRGYVTDDIDQSINFPIYQSVGVTDEQAVTATTTIISAYNGLGDAYKGQLSNANVEIWIVPVDGSVAAEKINGKVIMHVRWNQNEAQIANNFQSRVIPLLSP